MHIKSLASLAAVALIVGCQNTELPQPLTATAVGGQRPNPSIAYNNSQNVDSQRQAEGDASGPLPASVLGGVQPLPAASAGSINTSVNAPAPTVIDKAVKETISSPTSRPLGPGASLNNYQTIGAVVTNVSGTPIYADKVIAALTPLLKSEAKQRDADSYKQLAKSEINKQVEAMINNELEYAAASQNLGKDEKTFAENYTSRWRADQITQAGGSLEVARHKAQADGSDFDEMVSEEYRKVFVQLFYQKKVFPKVQVTAADMRRYYDQHVHDEFSQVDQAKFRVIKITPKNMGGRSAAIEKIHQLHDQAARGDDFEKLAKGINHDPALMRSGGLIGGGDGWVQKGSYAVTDVEDAVWKLQPGQVSDVIESDGNFYIAKLEDRKLGKTRAFEDEDVQLAIRDKLTKQQMTTRRDQLRKKLMENSVIYPYPPETAPVLEIAMQKYPQWAGK